MAKVWWFCLLVVLLAASVHPVSCTGALPGTCLEHSLPPPESHSEDPCDSYSVCCNPTSSLGNHIVIYFTCIVSVIVTFPALQPNSRSEDDTLFWWYLCFGCGGYMVWMYYYWCCAADSSFAVFPIYASSVFLAFYHFLLLVYASVSTSVDGDWRVHLMYVAPIVLWFIALLMWLCGVNWIGWWGLALTSLAHAFRIASTNYRADVPKLDLCCTGVEVPFWMFSAFISLMGAISDLLWLRNPQLCLSREFKLTSYIIAILRGWELFLWCSRAIARGLSKIEGKVVAAIPDIAGDESLVNLDGMTWRPFCFW